MKRARFRLSIAPNRCSLWDSATSRVLLMIMNATAPQRCLPRWILLPARCSPRASLSTGTKSISRFLKRVEENIPTKLDVHLVVDNYATHKHPAVKRWLATQPRWTVHYTPTYASWLNQVEIWFNIITQKAIRRGTFKSVKELTTKIDQYVRHYNRHSHLPAAGRPVCLDCHGRLDPGEN